MLNMKFKLKVGSFSGNSAMSRWSMNQQKKIERETEKRMFRASGFLRTDIKRSMGRRIAARQDYKGYHWKSHPPSAAGKPPRKRARGKAGLQHITFLQVEKFEFRVGPDMFPAEGFGKNTKFKGDVMHMTGGNGQVKLPLEPEQIPPGMRALAYSGAKSTWPMTFKNCHYKKRDYLTPSRKKVVAKFPFLFANLNVPQ
jgi:hypothetical protein